MAHGQRGDGRKLEEFRWKTSRDTEAEQAKHGRARAQAGHQSKKNDVDAKPEQLRPNVTHLHAQRAEGEDSGAGQSSRPRAARKGGRNTRERHAGRDRQPAAAGEKSKANSRREEQSQQQARRAKPRADKANQRAANETRLSASPEASKNRRPAGTFWATIDFNV